MPISSRSLCLHHNFAVDARIARLEREKGIVEGYSAEVRATCQDCGEPFRWVGVPAGYDPLHPRTSIDGVDLRAPIAPCGDAAILATSAQYRMPERKVDAAMVVETIESIRTLVKPADELKLKANVVMLTAAQLHAWANTLERALGHEVAH